MRDASFSEEEAGRREGNEAEAVWTIGPMLRMERVSDSAFPIACVVPVSLGSAHRSHVTSTPLAHLRLLYDLPGGTDHIHLPCSHHRAYCYTRATGVPVDCFESGAALPFGPLERIVCYQNYGHGLSVDHRRLLLRGCTLYTRVRRSGAASELAVAIGFLSPHTIWCLFLLSYATLALRVHRAVLWPCLARCSDMFLPLFFFFFFRRFIPVSALWSLFRARSMLLDERRIGGTVDESKERWMDCDADGRGRGEAMSTSTSSSELTTKRMQRRQCLRWRAAPLSLHWCFLTQLTFPAHFLSPARPSPFLAPPLLSTVRFLAKPKPQTSSCAMSSSSLGERRRLALDSMPASISAIVSCQPRAEIQTGQLIKLPGQQGFFRPAPLLNPAWTEGRMRQDKSVTTAAVAPAS